MPEVTRFDGIVAQIYGKDHPPPHIHFRSSTFKVKMQIDDRRIVRVSGSLPGKRARILAEWVSDKESILLEFWAAAYAGEPTDGIWTEGA